MQKFFWQLQDHLIDFLGIEDTGNDQERWVDINWLKLFQPL